MEELPDQGKEEINKINRELVARLKVTDSAFSIGIHQPSHDFVSDVKFEWFCIFRRRR